MSFYFSKQARKAAAKPAGKPKLGTPRNARANVATLHRLGCQACPLNKADIHTPKMVPTLAKQTLIMFLAEAPGRDEDENTGRPLTGPSGTLLRQCISSSVVAQCSFDNVCNCRPPKNRTPTWNEIECCHPRRIKYIEQAKPKLIVGLGAVPLSAILKSGDIAGMRGRMFAVKIGNHSCWFMPTYHPSYILRTAFDKKKPLNSRLGHCFRMDIKRACEMAATLKTPHVDTEAEVREGVQCFDGTKAEDYGKLCALLDHVGKARYASVDIETNCLRPYLPGAEILSIAFSTDEVNFSFSFLPRDWSTGQYQGLRERYRLLLKSPGLVRIAHNAPFEIEWFAWAFGRDVVDHAGWECTQMQAHFLDERRGRQGDGKAPYQSLGFLTKQYFGINIKNVFKVNKKDMAKTDLGEMLVYNAADTKYTLRLYHTQNRLLKQRGLHDAYLESLPRQTSVALMQSLGVLVDQQEVKRNQQKLEMDIVGVEASMDLLPVVREYKADHREVNFAAGPDALIIFRDYLKRPEVVVAPERNEVFDFDIASEVKRKAEETGLKTRYSVDKNVLDKIDHPLAPLVTKLRNLTKMKSTYVDVLELGKGKQVYPDGRIHCNFNTTFAETGRTSCVASWTPIKTSRGTVPIKDVVVGDCVWTHRARWQPITALWRKGYEPMLDLYLSNGEVLTCTKNHRLLLSSSKWTTAGALYDFFKEMGGELGQCGSGFTGLQKQRSEVSENNCRGIGNQDQQCLVGYQTSSEQARAHCLKDAEIFSFQTWRQEPYEGQIQGGSSQMGGGMQRWKGLPYGQSWYQENVCTPSGHYEGPWPIIHSQRMGCSSHRQQSTKQQYQQSCLDHPSWAPRYSLKATGVKDIEIEKIEACGSREVFDFTVAEDASYAACGVFSHNSDEPNMQNFPQRRDAWIRGQIVAPKGHVLVAFDYGQLEGCTTAMCSKDKVLVQAMWDDYDLHMEWSRKLHARYPAIGEVNKALRSRIKNKLVFPAIFGAQNKSIAAYLGGIPEDVVDDLMDEFWQTFHGLKRWQDDLMKKYYELGYVESPTGRRHHYPLNRNQVINHPVQSFACDIVCSAMNELSLLAVESGKWHLHPVLNIHDDLTFCIPDDDNILEESIDTIYRVMLSPPYPEVNVPLSVSASIGPRWHGMTEIGKFYSHKDL